MMNVSNAGIDRMKANPLDIKPGSLTEALDLLAAAIDNLEATACNLLHGIVPVLQAEPPEPASNVALAPPPTGSFMVERVRHERQRIEKLFRELDSARARLAL